LNTEVAADEGNPFAGVAEANAPVKDRLTTTLFLAALFHGIVILGITFTAPFRETQDTPPLEVLLLPDDSLSDAPNPNAFYLAQRNQQGSGTSEEARRASTPPPAPLPTELLGQLEGDGLELRKAHQGQSAAELITSRSTRTEVSYLAGETQSDQRNETPLATQTPPEALLASAAIEDKLSLRGKRTLEVTPDTRESRIAPYLDAWRRKVERLGTVNYPNQARRRAMQGNPVLEVTIRADGSLEDIRVRRTSGHPEIDQAALGILRLASPFDPFPAQLKAEYDQLRFAYEWQFVGGATRGTVTLDRNAVR
jgi:periplasmic protein TonB